MSRWAALGIAAGLMGTAFLSACSPDGGLKASTPALFAAPQNRAMVDSAEPVHTSDDLDLLYVFTSPTGRRLRIRKPTRSPMARSARAR